MKHLAISRGAAIAIAACAKKDKSAERIERLESELSELQAKYDKLAAEKAEADEPAPEPAAKSEPAAPEEVELSVAANGDVKRGDEVLDDAGLDELFAGLFKSNPETRLVISADLKTKHGRVVDVMDRAKAAGLTRMAIVTPPSEPALTE
jgi:biopolymer transport protein ExbD